ncbi:hypothetical protein F441_01012 [Phytophthora nicotianae CJ01A1]|uniref:Uncharacterized protein n=4 Tax=Phytophthora nicotianae TaxID=4792 RepID=W3A4N7_PHYNI|nr:hypothetical protein L915_00973 [Phytophthora nicotianae]ETL49575.1 hypothetical protein L916_00962 [Phytophthora nicotianae]ETO85130.1 hypothetical protein F444_01042 [Phytophthora nicotianae P1976]ETP26192.1 hypothetical protein F441_01012 [Phytophthora nicotianae CJ01A1]ETP54175.1 hypothetical protein F442_00986 [Phytophthora nicotianae P10297]
MLNNDRANRFVATGGIQEGSRPDPGEARQTSRSSDVVNENDAHAEPAVQGKDAVDAGHDAKNLARIPSLLVREATPQSPARRPAHAWTGSCLLRVTLMKESPVKTQPKLCQSWATPQARYSELPRRDKLRAVTRARFCKSSIEPVATLDAVIWGSTLTTDGVCKAGAATSIDANAEEKGPKAHFIILMLFNEKAVLAHLK